MKKLISIFLAILMLASNVGIAANTHFCGGKAVKRSISLGFEHLDCGMDQTKRACSVTDNQEDKLQSKPCCENQHELFQLSDEVTAQHQNDLQLNKTFVAAFIHTFVVQLFSYGETTPNLPYYSPPELKQDVQVLFQTFLI